MLLRQGKNISLGSTSEKGKSEFNKKPTNKKRVAEELICAPLHQAARISCKTPYESQPLTIVPHDLNADVVVSHEDLEIRRANAREANRKFQIAIKAFELEDKRKYARGSGFVKGKPTLILCSDDFSSIEEQEAFRQRMLKAIGDTPCNLEFHPCDQADF